MHVGYGTKCYVSTIGYEITVINYRAIDKEIATDTNAVGHYQCTS